MPRRFGRSVLLIVALVVSALAQAPDAPSFRAGTTLVEFTLVVTGEDGRYVTDLRQEDVSIVEAGRPREVAFFHYEGAPPAAIRVRTEPLPPASSPIAPNMRRVRRETDRHTGHYGTLDVPISALR